MKPSAKAEKAPKQRNGKLIPNAVTRCRNAHGDWCFTAHRPEDAGPSAYRAKGSNKDGWDVYDADGELVGVVKTLASVREAIFGSEF